MIEGTPIEEVLEGAQPLPNDEYVYENYANLSVKNVVIYGTRILDTQEQRFKYRPTIALFMNDPGEPPQMLNFHLHEIFEDAEVMARMTVMWANMMFGNVSKMVSIFDYENPAERLAHINVVEMVALENAVDELKQIHRTNMRKIH